MPVQTIKKLNVSEVAFEQIKTLIATGEWKPGEKIPAETELASRMCVSRVSIRAALQKLASLGLVERKQGHGTIVCSFSDGQQMNQLLPMLIFSPPDIRSMNEFRMILECGTVELSAQRCSSDTIRRLEENLAEMQERRENQDYCAELDVDFHYIIAEAAGNQLIMKTLQVMRDSFFECMREYKRITNMEAGFYYHRSLIEALRNKDSFGARRIMEEHLRKNQHDIEMATARREMMN